MFARASKAPLTGFGLWLGIIALQCTLLAAQVFVHSPHYFRNPYLINALYLIAAQTALLLPRPERANIFRPPGRTPVYLLISILLFGAYLRTVGFTTYLAPDSDVIEEAQTGSIASFSMARSSLDPDFPLVDLLAETGLTIGGASMLALRVPFVIYSILGIYFFFLAARGLLRSPLIALGVTLVFASNAYLAASGRVAMETYSPIATTALALAACFHARNRFEPFSWGLAGIAVGLLWQEYFAYRMVSTALVPFMLAILAQGPPTVSLTCDSRPLTMENLRRFRVLIIVFLVMAAATVGPVIVANLQRGPPGGLIEGLNRHLPKLLSQLSTMTPIEFAGMLSAKILVTANYIFSAQVGDVISKETGLFDRFSGVLAIFGLLWCLVTSYRRPARCLLWAIPILAIVLSSLLIEWVDRFRTMGNIPFFILALAVIVEDIWIRFPRRWLGVLLAIALVFLVQRDVTRLFKCAINDELVKAGFADPLLTAAIEIQRMQQEEPDAVIYVIDRSNVLRAPGNLYSFLYNWSPLRFLESFDSAQEPGLALYFAVEPADNATSLQRIEVSKLRKFPGRTEQVIVGRIKSSDSHDR